MNKPLLSFINIFLFLLLFHGTGISSEVKREVLRFSSDSAQIKKGDGILHLSGEVKISYGQYVIRSDLLMAKTNSVDSSEVKIIEASIANATIIRPGWPRVILILGIIRLNQCGRAHNITPNINVPISDSSPQSNFDTKGLLLIFAFVNGF